ncbi:MAG: hypothetical protein IPO78_06845 [Saprospiraceae bacterium]|nr:hypothetical protein [Saprospiraceae bacterium]
MKKLLYSLVLFSICALSCIDHDFDAPPQVTDDIGFQPNSSIAALKTKFVAGKFIDITDDLLIHAIIVADDKSGNFYKTLVIQDSTGGIELKINRTGLYANFPVGMKIGLRCKGLTIGDYNGLIQIGQGTYQNGNFTNLSGIEDALVDRYVFKGPRNQVITPKKRTIPALIAQDLSTLIQLDDLEFIRSDTGKTFADIIGKNPSNLLLTDCAGNEIILRTSDFADFAGNTVPPTNGSIVVILSKFKSDAQLYIRTINDIQFSKPACKGGSGGNGALINILDLRKLFTGTITNAPDLTKIIGTVISDRVNQNTTSRNLQLQDQTGGITVRFSANHSFSVGDQIEINVSKQELSEFDGLLQVNNVDLLNAKKLGTLTVVPSKKTIAQIVADFENLESTLVELTDVAISKSSGASYSGTCTIKDASGMMDLYTRTAALFANDNFPTGNVKIIGIVTQGGAGLSKQVAIRKTSDVSGGGTGGTPELISLKDIRATFLGTITTVASNKKIRATVISDKDNMNTTTKNIHIQDASGGIVVRFTVDHSFSLGDELEINVSNQELSEFSGLLQVNNVPLANATKIGTNTIIPVVKTIAEILNNFESLESTLVEVSDIAISKASGTTYSGTCILSDGTGTMDLFTRSQASFSGTNFQTSKVKIVAFVNQGGALLSKQLSIRKITDITP